MKLQVSAPRLVTRRSTARTFATGSAACSNGRDTLTDLAFLCSTLPTDSGRLRSSGGTGAELELRLGGIVGGATGGPVRDRRPVGQLCPGPAEVPAQELVDHFGAVGAHHRRSGFGILPLGIVNPDGPVLGSGLVRHTPDRFRCTYRSQRDSLAVYVHQRLRCTYTRGKALGSNARRPPPGESTA